MHSKDINRGGIGIGNEGDDEVGECDWLRVVLQWVSGAGILGGYKMTQEAAVSPLSCSHPPTIRNPAFATPAGRYHDKYTRKTGGSALVKCVSDAKTTEYNNKNIDSPVASLPVSVDRLRPLQSRLAMPRIPLG